MLKLDNFLKEFTNWQFKLSGRKRVLFLESYILCKLFVIYGGEPLTHCFCKNVLRTCRDLIRAGYDLTAGSSGEHLS